MRYTPAAFDTAAGQAALAELASRNGVDFEGTPLIREVGEIEDDGFVEVTIPPLGGPDLRWFLCPVIEDPRHVAIAPDAHLDIVSLPDGSPLPSQQDVFDTFHCLQATGDDCNDWSGIGLPFCGANPNSTGAAATIDASSSRSVAANALTLNARRLPVGTPAMFVSGTTSQHQPFGDGFLCVSPVTRIQPRVIATGGTATLTLDFGAPAFGGAAAPGSTLYFQCWYRDPGGPGGSGYNFTHGLRVELN